MSKASDPCRLIAGTLAPSLLPTAHGLRLEALPTGYTARRQLVVAVGCSTKLFDARPGARTTLPDHGL